MSIEARKQALKYLFSQVAEPLGYRLTTNDWLLNFCLEQEAKNEEKLGIPYCPCQMLTRDREHDMKLVCPCIPFHRKHYDAMKRCWCGLFVHKDVVDESKLRQIPAKEV